ncbi:hypothetical protein L210DRAFT_944180 [Boletus edulis BED1]|uniref:Uncharacterized protein n=1 Tax=Boletus edulis BED1 TaxID=1328754 RepID=A0AAD4GJ81_BOLED|nr:hypothetical protein L210DRAFT_944180 [Boletus edulis BED1]
MSIGLSMLATSLETPATSSNALFQSDNEVFLIPQILDGLVRCCKWSLPGELASHWVRPYLTSASFTRPWR